VWGSRNFIGCSDELRTWIPFTTHITFVFLFYSGHKSCIDQVLTRILRLHTHSNENDALKHVLQTNIPQAQSRNHALHVHACGVLENQDLKKLLGDTSRALYRDISLVWWCLTFVFSYEIGNSDSMQQCTSWQAISRSSIQNVPRYSHILTVHYCLHVSLPPNPAPRYLNPIHTLPQYLFKK
jgi:hypothetical protein